MSDIEIVGVVASILQIAELGMRLSVKLCSFHRQIKEANQSAQRLSSDISLTCSILHELGVALQHDDQIKVCSKQAFLTAQEVLGECKRVFQSIDDAIESQNPENGKNSWKRQTRRLMIFLLGPDLDMLKSHLDRLKTTMLLMLNVIMYAGQLHRKAENSLLKDQRKLIDALLQEHTEIEGKYKGLVKSGKARETFDTEGPFALSSVVPQPGVRASQSQQLLIYDEIEIFFRLISTLINEIDVCQSDLEESRYLRIRKGVMNVYSAELVRLRRAHGDEIMQAIDVSSLEPGKPQLPAFRFSNLPKVPISQRSDPGIPLGLGLRGGRPLDEPSYLESSSSVTSQNSIIPSSSTKGDKRSESTEETPTKPGMDLDLVFNEPEINVGKTKVEKEPHKNADSRKNSPVDDVADTLEALILRWTTIPVDALQGDLV